MRAEKLGIALQRFRKYSSSFRGETAGFIAEKRRRFAPFSAAIGGRGIEAVFVRRIWWDVSARAVDFIETASSGLRERARTADRSASSRRSFRPTTSLSNDACC